MTDGIALINRPVDRQVGRDSMAERKLVLRIPKVVCLQLRRPNSKKKVALYVREAQSLDRVSVRERLRIKAIRVCEQAYHRGALLSSADLAELMSGDA